jgi:DNA-binding transcriptional regulator/RsmH inhibitor MraZ
VEISKEVIMAGQDGKIEIWAKHLYEQMQESEDDFAHLAQQIMGNDSNAEKGE